MKTVMALLTLLTVLFFWLSLPPHPQQPSRGQIFYASWQLKSQSLPTHLPMPVQGIRPRQLRDTWGAARSGGRQHEGIDIFAPKGTPVLAATQGMVLSVGENALGGASVWVLGPAATRHYYTHLSGYGRYRSGDWVHVGDVLGYVGNTGNAKHTPPHLHYGIYEAHHGATNPYPYLRYTPAHKD
jgi:murein DD-endopeptidase MepM/ murein hydrolase activator NlpD